MYILKCNAIPSSEIFSPELRLKFQPTHVNNNIVKNRSDRLGPFIIQFHQFFFFKKCHLDFKKSKNRWSIFAGFFSHIQAGSYLNQFQKVGPNIFAQRYVAKIYCGVFECVCCVRGYLLLCVQYSLSISYHPPSPPPPPPFSPTPSTL